MIRDTLAAYKLFCKEAHYLTLWMQSMTTTPSNFVNLPERGVKILVRRRGREAALDRNLYFPM